MMGETNNASYHAVAWTGGEQFDYEDTNNGVAVSFGAEALSQDTKMDAEDNDWVFVENFKLYLHSAHMKVDGMKLDQVVLAHPNGWDVRQQSFLRNAAVECGVFNPPGETIAKNIRFETEAEASVHYCIKHTNLSSQLNVGARFAVCDAGGSTVDATLYRVTSTQPVLQLGEVDASASIPFGEIVANRTFEARLSKGLEALGLDSDTVGDYSKAAIEDFEFTTKRSFDFDNPDRKFNIKVARDKAGHGGHLLGVPGGKSDASEIEALKSRIVSMYAPTPLPQA
ncbi:unnamed protein product [Rhizoctonia solani]|uniref:Uncharacterized protein n=1 Tax=Rhizoctonia solani TaxID=456999 RepID=A0A8H3H932_9AGAM|nr:unnamed protein product [Rhizoctonia solani]